MSKIPWCDETINPFPGCERCSEGCEHCYAIPMAHRLANMPHTRERYAGLTEWRNGRLDWTGKRNFVPSELEKPARWKKPRLIFVCSMGDIFHEGVKDKWLNELFRVIYLNRQHFYTLLTKRPDLAKARLKKIGIDLSEYYYVGLGVTVENDKHRDRVGILLQIPAALRFVSYEPGLGAPFDNNAANKYLTSCVDCGNAGSTEYIPHREKQLCANACDKGGEGPSIDWIICGGETGPGARPMHPDWARSLRNQCKAAGVSFFFKRWGNWKPLSQCVENECVLATKFRYINDDGYAHLGNKAAGRLLDGVEYNEMPEAITRHLEVVR